jgi:hypothetical protein
MHTHANQAERVLELAGDGSRTESRNTERLIAYLDKLADVEPAPVRMTEKLLALLVCVLAVGYLEGGDLAVQIVRESYPASVVKNCERNTRVAVAALNGWTIQTDEVKVSCKRVKS